MWINVTFIMVTKVTMSYKSYYTHNKNVNREIRQLFAVRSNKKMIFEMLLFCQFIQTLKIILLMKKSFILLRYWIDYL